MNMISRIKCHVGSYRFEKENVKYFIKDYLLIKAQVLGQRNETLVLQF